MTKESLEFLIAACGGIFGAGVAWATMRVRINKNTADLNGLGRKFGRVVALLIRWADTEERRKELADAVDPR